MQTVASWTRLDECFSELSSKVNLEVMRLQNFYFCDMRNSILGAPVANLQPIPVKGLMFTRMSMARMSQKCSESSFKLMKNALRYLLSTKWHGVRYSKGTAFANQLITFVDASLGTCSMQSLAKYPCGMERICLNLLMIIPPILFMTPLKYSL